MREPVHFCDDPRVALCGRSLVEHNLDFKLFYENTANSFAHVACQKCRDEIRRLKLAPGSFPDPQEWASGKESL